MDIWSYIKDPIEKRILQRKITNKVFQYIDAYNEHVNTRRKRLQSLLFEEECQFTDELKQQEKVKTEYILQKQSEEQRALEERKNKEEEELLAKKLIQLDMVKCKEIQPLIRKRRELEAYEMQQRQIQELREKLENSKQMDKLWYLKMLGDAEKNKELEQRKLKEKMQKEAEMKEFLTAQMLISQEVKKKTKLKETEEVIKIVEECDKKLSIRNEKELQKLTDSKMKLAEELKNQIIEHQNKIKKEKEDIMNIETKITKTCLTKQQEETNNKLKELEKRRQELELYGQHAIAVKQEREARERAEEIMVAEEAKKQMDENDRRRKLETKKSVDLLKEAMSVRETQLIEKRRELEKAAQLAAAEKEKRILKETIAKEEAIRQKRELAQAKNQYKQFLEEQMKHRKISEEAHRNQTLLEIKKKQQEEKQFNDKMFELMKREFATEKTHPFARSVSSTSSQNLSLRKVPETPYCKY